VFYPTFVLVFPGPQDDIANTTTLMSTFNNNSFYAPVPVVDLNSNYALAGKLDVMSGRCAPLNLSMLNATANQTNTTVTNLSNATISACQNFTNVTASSTDFSGDITVVTGSTTNALAKSLLYTVVAPLFSLLITGVFVKELGSLLGSEIGLRTVASV